MGFLPCNESYRAWWSAVWTWQNTGINDWRKFAVLATQFHCWSSQGWRGPLPSRTVFITCCGLSLALKSTNRINIDIFNSPNFHQFRETLNACMMDQKASGNFTIRQAEPITEEVEDLLWSKGLLGDSTPQALFDILVFYLGLYFMLRNTNASVTDLLNISSANLLVMCLTLSIKRMSPKPTKAV